MMQEAGSPGTGGPVLIRASLEQDIAALQAIYAYYVNETAISFETEAPDVEEMLRRRQNVLDAGLSYLVAEVDGQVVGYCYAVPYRPRPAYRYTIEESVYVAPEHQGKGAGRALLEALIADCVAKGRKQMLAVITAGPDEGPSERFHVCMGFRPVGRLHKVGFKQGVWYDTLFMQRAL